MRLSLDIVDIDKFLKSVQQTRGAFVLHGYSSAEATVAVQKLADEVLIVDDLKGTLKELNVTFNKWGVVVHALTREER